MLDLDQKNGSQPLSYQNTYYISKMAVLQKHIPEIPEPLVKEKIFVKKVKNTPIFSR